MFAELLSCRTRLRCTSVQLKTVFCWEDGQSCDRNKMQDKNYLSNRLVACLQSHTQETETDRFLEPRLFNTVGSIQDKLSFIVRLSQGNKTKQLANQSIQNSLWVP